MARLLLSCDDYLYRHTGHYYFQNREWADFYQRYLRVFEKLRICNRVIDEEQLNPARVRITDERIEVRPIPIFHGPVEYARSYLAVGKAMKSAVDGCDAAILRLPCTVAQRLSSQVVKSGIPYATEIVFDASDGADTSRSIVERVLWRIIHRKMQRICKEANGVACVTERYLQQRYFSELPGNFTEHYSTLALDKSFFTGTREFPVKPILTIAHVDWQIGLHSRKGTDTLIRIVAKLKEQGFIVNAVLAGDDRGSSSQQIMDFARQLGVDEQVTCCGYLDRERLSRFLDEADMFVFPTKAEGLPRVVIEAMAKGLPAVTSPASGNPELIASEWLVPFTDVDGYVGKIKQLLQSPELYEQTSRRNFEQSLQYEASILEQRRDAFYSQLRSLCRP